eukprot:CAMPEP_0195156040 /NCGR_PEP_ID=MMETSP0448-20130528/184461_1 /TAXON_ID=66468 /ORGANISM="Heterocapsa triquestra, Strain CCMP 448" /LENGTH=72 /DNA_ID=CAMNT_0040194829 /DNA_START=124 /DNA_END=342 /DNA_ORIENTATION=+
MKPSARPETSPIWHFPESATCSFAEAPQCSPARASGPLRDRARACTVGPHGRGTGWPEGSDARLTGSQPMRW